MNGNIWTNHKLRVFPYLNLGGKDEEIPTMNEYSGIQAIEFDGNSKTCSYCGHDYDGIECQGCSARKSIETRFHAGRATVHIGGVMPQSEYLMNPPARIDILYFFCGAPLYKNAQDIIHLTECKLKKAVVELGARPWETDDVVIVNAQIECNVEIEHNNRL